MASEIMTPAKIERARNETGYEIKLWQKGSKCRLYVRTAKEDCGYITENENDVFGHRGGFWKGLCVQYTRPANANRLYEVVESLIR